MRDKLKVSEYLATLPTTDDIGESLRRNAEEAKLLRELLRLARQQEQVNETEEADEARAY